MTTPDHLESEVSDALAQVRKLESEQARAQASADAAQADYERELARLTEEHGVATAAEAKALYDSLTEQLQTELAAVNAALAQAEEES